MITNPEHGITLGGLSLMAAGDSVDHAAGFTTEVSADGTTWGNPQVVVSSLISELSSGDIVTQQHVGNREPVLYVRISADTHAGLIAGDTALSAVVGPPCELTWQNPDPAAPLTVIDVLHSRMDHSWDDMDSLRRRRTWIVTMSALPDVRSADLVITPAVATAASTVVNSGSATTGWTTGNGVVSVVSGAVVSTYSPAVDFGGFSGSDLILTGTIDTTVQKYIAVDWKSSLPGLHNLWFNSDPFSQSAEVRREPAPTATFTRSWYKVSAATLSLSSIKFVIVHPLNTGSATLSIDQVIKAETLPANSTFRQLTRTVDPDGNVPAEGSILVQHSTAGLWQTMVYSHPAIGGYSPALRPWRSSSDAVSANAFAVSGFFNSINGNCIFHVPAEAVPEGEVHLWARLNKASSGGTVNVSWAAVSAMGTTSVGDQQQGTTACNFPLGDTWYLFPIARLTLPTTPIGPAGFVGIAIQAAGANIVIDDAWLFAMDKGRLTVVDCGNGAPTVGAISNRLRIDAPSLEKPFGGILTGTATDWSDAYGPPATKVLCDQTGHRFDPAGSAVFVVAAGPTSEVSVSFEHYPRWRAEAGS